MSGYFQVKLLVYFAKCPVKHIIAKLSVGLAVN